MLSARQKKLKWPGISPQEAKWDRRCKIAIEAEVDSREDEASFMQCSPFNPSPMANRMCQCSKCSRCNRCHRWQYRPVQDSTVVEKRRPDATIAAGMAISIGSVPLHRRHLREAEDEVAVEDITEDDVEDDVEEGDSRIPKVIQRMLL